MTDLFSCQAARITVVSVLVCCCLPLAFIVLTSSEDKQLHHRTPYRVHLQRRYPTEKEVVGPNYIQHTLPDVPIDLKARYDKRRLLVKHGRTKLQARSSVLERFRRNGQPTLDTKDYVPLLTDSDRQPNLQCGSCSLVTNSGYMRRSSLGEEIDQADCVFRMDAAPTVGYERDVGRRTTVRVVSYTSVSDLASQADTLLALKPSATHLIFHGPEHVYSSRPFQKYLQHLTVAEPEIEMYRTGRALEDRADFKFLQHTGKSRLSTSSEFSSEMYALQAMRNACSAITVYGMLPRDFCSENPSSNVSFSYFQDLSLSACSVYDYHDNLEIGGQPLRDEKQVFNGWKLEGDIHFVHPSWEWKTVDIAWTIHFLRL